MQRSLHLTDKGQQKPPQSSDFWGGLHNGRSVTPARVGTLSFLGLSSQCARLDGTCFPCGVFLHCASNARLPHMSTRKRAWQRMPLLRLPWAKSLSLVAIPAAGRQKAMVAALAR
jgi:hypothetical protein